METTRVLCYAPVSLLFQKSSSTHNRVRGQDVQRQRGFEEVVKETEARNETRASESRGRAYTTQVCSPFTSPLVFSMEIEYGNVPNPGGAKPVNAEDKDLKDTMGRRLILSLRPAHLTRPSPLFRLV